MKLHTFFIALLFSATCWSQNSISYKSVIKDTSGSVISNTLITIQFGILEDVTLVYEESHSITTDQNGMIITAIGEGTLISGNFNTIDWANDNHYLNVKINYGSGLIDFGTTRFMHVPYAIVAENAKNVTGLEALDEGNGIGYRIIDTDHTLYGNIGENAIDLSLSTNTSSQGATADGAIAIGVNSTASGQSAISLGTASKALGDLSTAIGFRSYATEPASIAIGLRVVAKGSNSLAMGKTSLASGSNAITLGNQTIASGTGSFSVGTFSESQGNYSTAIGYSAATSGNYATAIGTNLLSKAYNSFAIGRFNVGQGNSESWVSTDPIFEIGNGNSYSNRSNALTILKNGNLGITTATPKVKLHITGGTDAGLYQDGGYLVIGETTGKHMVIDNNEIMVKENGEGRTLYLNNDGGALSVGGNVVHNSDRRLKQDIETLPYGLEEILQLESKQYYWKNRGTETYKSFGLIAQEVQSILREIVHTADDQDKTLSISYTELIPVLINAIQEQNKEIENLKKALKTQKSLEERISSLEQKISN